MSLNWDRRDLARRLKQTRVAITDVRVGDIVVDDDIPWGVAKVETRDDGTTWLRDEDNNGTSQPADAGWLVTIIDRCCLKDPPKE